MKKGLIAAFVLCFWIPAFTVPLPSVDLPKETSKSDPLVSGEKLTIHSRVLKEERIVLVQLPEGYRESKRKFPVLYLLDGEFFFQQVASTVRFLSECGYMGPMWNRKYPVPQMIVVGIVNVDRNRDYTPTHRVTIGSSRFPTSGGADKFLEFLESELIPYIDSHFRTHPFRIVSGWSFGGLFTVHAFLNKPGVFDAYIAVSPTMSWDNQLPVKQAAALSKSGKLNTKPLVVTLGNLEKGGSMEQSVTNGLVPLLKNNPAGKANFQYLEIENENHFSTPYKAFYEGLRSIYSNWVLPEKLAAKGPESIKTFYRDLSGFYGYPVEMPQTAYSRIAFALHDQGKIKAAMETAAVCQQRYPESSYPIYLEGRLHQRQNNLVLAGKCFRKAIDFENARTIPDSESLGTYKMRIRQISRE
jgi:predicted alpha/beta superfamily hydrolase